MKPTLRRPEAEYATFGDTGSQILISDLALYPFKISKELKKEFRTQQL